MAVPFYVPDHDDNADRTNITNYSPNMTSSATQTPLQSPVNGEHLVQAFCDALYRCSLNGSQTIHCISQTPQSPSCTIHNVTNAYENEDIFFPRHRDIIFNPRSNSTGNQLFEQINNNQNIENSSRRHSSTCDNSTECDRDFNCNDIEERLEHYLSDRERLQEFSGRIPIKKTKRDLTERHKAAKVSQSFTWPTFVTVFVFALGCGILVAR